LSNHDLIDEAVKSLMQVCSQNGVTAIVALQEEKGSFRTISKKTDSESSDRLKLVKLALRSGDIDSLLKSIISDAQSNGHNSLYLKAMGIPEKAN
jgi:hypothetical protein